VTPSTHRSDCGHGVRQISQGQRRSSSQLAVVPCAVGSQVPKRWAWSQ